MSAGKRQSGWGQYLRLCYSLSDLVLFNVVFAFTLWLSKPIGAYEHKLLWVLINISYMAVIVKNRGFRHRDRTILLDRVVAEA